MPKRPPVRRRSSLYSRVDRFICREVNRPGGPADAKMAITEMLTDLRHYCEDKGLDFSHLDALAYSHYCEEDGQCLG